MDTVMMACTVGLLLLASVHLAAAATSQPVLITFGDSLTDNGNLFKLTHSMPSPKLGYWKGRATNSPGTWTDWVPTLNRQVQVQNFAYVDATACDYSMFLPKDLASIPYLGKQVEMFNKKLKDSTFKKSLAGKLALPTIFIGHQDLALMSKLPKDVAALVPMQTVGCILAAAKGLLQAGQPGVIVATVAPVQFTPVAVQSGVSKALAPVVRAVNSAITAGVAELAAQYKDRHVLLWDVETASTAYLQNPKAHGFKYGSEKTCVSIMAKKVSVCTSPNQYIFFDDMNPTSQAHKILAQSMLDLLSNAGLTKKA